MLSYAAGRLGTGSEVLSFDTPQAIDLERELVCHDAADVRLQVTLELVLVDEECDLMIPVVVPEEGGRCDAAGRARV